MMPMAILRRARKGRDDDLGTELANHADEIAEHLFMPPLLERFIRSFRKTKLVEWREKLQRVIEPPRGEQLFGANDAKGLE